MSNKEKCPACGCEDYEIQDEEDYYQDECVRRNWYCKCSDCKSSFTISYFYERKAVEVSY